MKDEELKLEKIEVSQTQGVFFIMFVEVLFVYYETSRFSWFTSYNKCKIQKLDKVRSK
jgi:hypothetical protein